MRLPSRMHLELVRICQNHNKGRYVQKEPACTSCKGRYKANADQQVLKALLSLQQKTQRFPKLQALQSLHMILDHAPLKVSTAGLENQERRTLEGNNDQRQTFKERERGFSQPLTSLHSFNSQSVQEVETICGSCRLCCRRCAHNLMMQQPSCMLDNEDAFTSFEDSVSYSTLFARFAHPNLPLQDLGHGIETDSPTRMTLPVNAPFGRFYILVDPRRVELSFRRCSRDHWCTPRVQNTQPLNDQES
jgi:hypothetical protein